MTTTERDGYFRGTEVGVMLRMTDHHAERDDYYRA
jgi:hypothetical protein